MNDNRLIFLNQFSSEFTVQFSDNFLYATIINPIYSENITVEDEGYGFTVYFSFQHRHFADEEDVIEWIREVIAGDIFAIEFFSNENRHFGGEIDATELHDLSYEKLEKFTGYYGSTKLSSIANTFKVRAWNDQHNFDAEFIYDNNGYISIQKL